MAFGGFSRTGAEAPMAEINMIPLIDVMLVLLVIFIITAPLLTHAVKIDLPKASSHALETRPDNVQLAIRETGQVYWNGERVEPAALDARLKEIARLEPQPEVHIRADRRTEYQRVAEVMSTVARAGVTRMGFITDPAEQRP